ncbi:hypothetical protein, partial [Streptomyces scabiei]|uniref:hypothetical protein n=1 Tax=Streptomyces scabiei TaxID=1930 RepID=UPI001F325711
MHHTGRYGPGTPDGHGEGRPGFGAAGSAYVGGRDRSVRGTALGGGESPAAPNVGDVHQLVEGG